MRDFMTESEVTGMVMMATCLLTANDDQVPADCNKIDHVSSDRQNEDQVPRDNKNDDREIADCNNADKIPEIPIPETPVKND
jgi:hypothetical protein